MICYASIASQFLTFAIASTIILSFRLGDRNLTQQQILSNDVMCFRRRSPIISQNLVEISQPFLFA